MNSKSYQNLHDYTLVYTVGNEFGTVPKFARLCRFTRWNHGMKSDWHNKQQLKSFESLRDRDETPCKHAFCARTF